MPGNGVGRFRTWAISASFKRVRTQQVTPEPEYFMSLALAEGRRALPACLPNPPVGCLLVREGRVVSRGHTQAPGQHHAEAMALAQLPSGSQQGLTAYVTLEPCSFHGRTPSCAHALVRQGIERVVIAILDPDRRNAGAGARILVDAGIEVIIGTGSEEAERDLRGYLLPGGA